MDSDFGEKLNIRSPLSPSPSVSDMHTLSKGPFPAATHSVAGGEGLKVFEGGVYFKFISGGSIRKFPEVTYLSPILFFSSSSHGVGDLIAISLTSEYVSYLALNSGRKVESIIQGTPEL